MCSRWKSQKFERLSTLVVVSQVGVWFPRVETATKPIEILDVLGWKS